MPLRRGSGLDQTLLVCAGAKIGTVSPLRKSAVVRVPKDFQMRAAFPALKGMNMKSLITPRDWSRVR